MATDGTASAAAALLAGRQNGEKFLKHFLTTTTREGSRLVYRIGFQPIRTTVHESDNRLFRWRLEICERGSDSLDIARQDLEPRPFGIEEPDLDAGLQLSAKDLLDGRGGNRPEHPISSHDDHWEARPSENVWNRHALVG